MLKQAVIPFSEHALETSRPWMMAMVWHRLAFLHWPVSVEVLRDAMPEVLRDQIDTFNDQAWLGVVPFDMSGIRARGTPTFPGVLAFPELNLRTYITVDGKPGFGFSL